MKKLILVMSLMLVVVLANACGVPQDDYAILQEQLAAKEMEATALEQQLQAAKAQGQEVAALQEQLTAREKEVTTLGEQLKSGPASS